MSAHFAHDARGAAAIHAPDGEVSGAVAERSAALYRLERAPLRGEKRDLFGLRINVHPVRNPPGNRWKVAVPGVLLATAAKATRVLVIEGAPQRVQPLDVVRGHHGAPFRVDKGSLIHAFQSQQHAAEVCSVAAHFLSEATPPLALEALWHPDFSLQEKVIVVDLSDPAGKAPGYVQAGPDVARELPLSRRERTPLCETSCFTGIPISSHKDWWLWYGSKGPCCRRPHTRRNGSVVSSAARVHICRWGILAPVPATPASS